MQLIAWSIPVFIALMVLEAWLARRRGLRIYRLPVAVSDLSRGITSQLFNLATINPRYLDRNYAGILITWDRIFGSFEPEGERPVYGTTKPLRSLNPLWANLHYFGEIAGLVAAAPRWRDRLYALFAHPGWRPGTAHAATTNDHHLGPDALRLRASQRYDVLARRGLNLYIAAQTLLAIPATMLLLIHASSLSVAQVLAGVGLVGAGTVAWAGLFERRRWAWPVEILRVAASVALLWSIAG